MKRSRQQVREIKKERQKKKGVEKVIESTDPMHRARGVVSVNVVRLKPGPYSGLCAPEWPEFVARGYYVDQPFQCTDCGAQEIWTARQQKWWYEIARGGAWTIANRCRPCRRRERERKATARKVHLEGLARKQHAE
ncbi:MAG: zinc-ribbon domain containing protein [Chthoniobacter sp.]